MPTIRKPLTHHARTQPITPAAVTLFERGKKLLLRPESVETERALNDLSYQLGAELGLKPWMTCPLEALGYAKPAYEDAEDWSHATEIAEALTAALRARRKARRAAETPPEPAPVT
jgi:hypothetical protein